ncbi:hypothetical protein [Streptomyces sp. NPDC054849]
MSSLLRAVAAAVTLAVCGAALTSCESEGRHPLPRTEPLTEAELESVLPSGRALPGYVATPRVSPTVAPHAGTGGGSVLHPGSPQACQALVDFRLDPVLHRPTAEVRADVSPLDDTSGKRDVAKFDVLVLSSYTVQEASAVMDSLKKAVPLCGTFVAYTLVYGDQEARIRVGKRQAPTAGDDTVAFDWTVPDIAMNDTVPVTVVRTGGVLATYYGEVPARIPQFQHEKLRAFLSGART